jgi:hypothetical protein
LTLGPLPALARLNPSFPARPPLAPRGRHAGHTYFEFEYTAKTPRYTRHSLAVVVVNDGAAAGAGSCWRGALAASPQASGGLAPACRTRACRTRVPESCRVLRRPALRRCGAGKFYTLTTGANERRWGKMKDKLTTSVRSFQLINA